MMKSVLYWLLGDCLTDDCLRCRSAAAGQNPSGIGFLDLSTAAGIEVLLHAFRQELLKLGWIEGKNVTIEYRFADQKTERLPDLAAELVPTQAGS